MPQIERIGRLTRPLTITCRSCGRQATWTVSQARKRLGGDCMVTDARRRLKCSVCAGQGAEFVDFA